MVELLALLSGLVITIMVSINGELTHHFGLYLGTVLIHFIGLITIYLVCKVKKASISFKNGLPYYFYLGGFVGVFTVFFNNFTIGVIGASLVNALGLLGQMVTSLVMEHFGLLGTKKNKLNFEKCISLFIILIGIGVML